MASNKSTATLILTHAADVLAQRGVEYDQQDTGERSMARAVRIFNSVHGGDQWLTEQGGWMFMLCLKLARGEQGAPKADTYVDLAAYAALLGESILDAERPAKAPPPPAWTDGQPPGSEE